MLSKMVSHNLIATMTIEEKESMEKAWILDKYLGSGQWYYPLVN